MSEIASAAAREPRRGREARRSARAQRSHASVPYITRKIPLTEMLSEEGLALDRTQRRDAAAGDRHRVSRLSPRAGALSQRRLRHQGRARALSARPRAAALRDGAGAVRAARAQSRAQRRHRRQRDGVRAQLRLALRPRSRQGPALRHDRRLPEFRQARLSRARSSTIPAARSASRSICRSTSGISRWSMRI